MNEKIAARDYEAARARVALLEEKYPDLIRQKLVNLDRIGGLRKRTVERVNSGAAKVEMGDFSKRFAFAGPVKSADEKGLAAGIRKAWGELTREETTNFYRKAAAPDSAEDFLGVAAYLVEGTASDRDYDEALDALGKAKKLNADVAGELKYVETLRRAAKEHAEAVEKGRQIATAEAPSTQRTEKTGTADERRSTPTQEKGKEPSAPSAVKSYDDIYVATAATGEKIPHPLSPKTYKMMYQGKRIDVPEGMVYVPAGEFLMGENESEHKVYLDAYFIGKYEVTNAEWKAFVEAAKFTPPNHWKGGEIPEGKDNHPVVYVSWEDAQKYCEWVNKGKGSGFGVQGSEVRLPTEAQWEKAARGPKAFIYPWGNNWDPRNCNWQGTWVGRYGLRFDPNDGVASDLWEAFTKSDKYTKEIVPGGGMTMPIGSFQKNKSFYGCYDMAGNVREWCWDWFKTDYYRLKDAKRNPQGPDEEDAEEVDFSGAKRKARVVRGGAWNYNATNCRAAYRYRYTPSSRNYNYGFRVVCGVTVGR